MYNITLISSFHKIFGKCNPNELCRIIEDIQPEVIFEELTFYTFEMIYSAGYKPHSLEAITVSDYLQKYPVKHYPVDTYPMDTANLFSGAQVIWNHSDEYRQLWKDKLLRITTDGYSFINSSVCAEMLDKMQFIEEAVLMEVNNIKLMDEYKAEKVLDNKREDEMLKNIYDYSEQHPFRNALFICGAQHRNPIKRKIQEYEAKPIVKLNWTFYNE